MPNNSIKLLDPDHVVTLRLLVAERDAVQERLAKVQADLDEEVLKIYRADGFHIKQVMEALACDRAAALRLLAGAVQRQKERVHGK